MSAQEPTNTLYPIFLKLEEMHVLLVGAGNVALEKAQSLLSNSPKATITIVAPFVRDELREYVSGYGSCNIIERGFEEDDLYGKHLVVCATDQPELHKRIKQLANNKNILVNVADTPSMCDFYLGSIVQKGNLKIAISTNGKSPTLAKRLRELFQEVLPAELESLMQNLNSITKSIQGDFAEKVRVLNELTRKLTEKK